MAQPLKLATPPEAVALRPPVQLRTPPGPALLAMARVTLLAAPVATLPLASRSVTATGKVPVPVAWMFWPVVGWALKLRLIAVPPVMLKALALLGPMNTPEVAFRV